jgi:hypothetical protein
MAWPDIKLSLPQWEAGDELPELRHSHLYITVDLTVHLLHLLVLFVGLV